MYQKLFERMAAIVEGNGAQREFEKYDKPFIEEYGLPMFWVVKDGYTNLTNLATFGKSFNESEMTRYDYVREGFDGYLYYIDHLSNDGTIYYLSDEGVREITVSQAHEIVRDLFTPVVEKWKAENGPLPVYTKVPVKISNISLSKLKELISDCHAHNDNSLLDCLKRFHQYRRVAKEQMIFVSYNPGCNEFTFGEYINGEWGLCGGIIFHGWPETGYKENNSVQLTPGYGWSTHT